MQVSNKLQEAFIVEQGNIMEYLIAVTLLAVAVSVLVCWALGLT
jgi:hypothetical protein